MDRRYYMYSGQLALAQGVHYIRSALYYQPEVRRGKYWGWGVFLFQYFPLVKI